MMCFPSAIRLLIGAIVFVATTLTLSAQMRTDIPRTISYQGLLSASDGATLPDGRYQITVTLFADPDGSKWIWQDTYTTQLTGGLFNLSLGDGNPLPDAIAMNTPLWIGTSIDGGDVMRPLTPLSASPYALNVSNQSITTEKLADGAVTAKKVDMDYISEIQIDGEKISSKGTVLNLVSTSTVPLKYDEATQSLTIGKIPAQTGDREKETSALTGGPVVWSIGGDGYDVSLPGGYTPGAGDWIGTQGGVTFDIRTYATPIMRYHTAVSGNDPNVEGGQGSSITAASMGSTIAGGASNTIAGDGNYDAIGGGLGNDIFDGDYNVIGGGRNNDIASGGIVAHIATIGGGIGNIIDADRGTIGGGETNSVTAVEGTIAGGHNNTIGLSGQAAFVGGGNGNTSNSLASAISGGGNNNIYPETFYSFIGGGENNSIGTAMAAIIADHATLGGGLDNLVDARYGTIGGGRANRVLSQSATLGGGENNTATGMASVVGGGRSNTVNALMSTVAGGFANMVDGSESFVGGGTNNVIGSGAQFATVGGGILNSITAPAGTIGGGQTNGVHAELGTVSGGFGNTVFGARATIAGGDGNVTDASYAQTVVGFYNAPRGAAVPVHPSGTTIATTDLPLFIVGNGDNSTGPPVRSNAFEVSYNGHATVFDVNGTGTPVTGRPVLQGTTYVDNVIYAWGNIDASGAILSDFGVASVAHVPGSGVYTITFNYLDPYGLGTTLTDVAVTATAISSSFASTTVTYPAGPTNTFTVYTYDNTLGLADLPFTFHMTGRP